MIRVDGHDLSQFTRDKIEILSTSLAIYKLLLNQLNRRGISVRNI